MKIKAELKVDLKDKEVVRAMGKAVVSGMTDTVVVIANDAIKLSPVLSGNNARSIKYEVGPHKEIAKKEGEGAIYSTSGYGGYLETGTVNMSARPYLRTSLDMHLKDLPNFIKTHLGRGF